MNPYHKYNKWKKYNLNEGETPLKNSLNPLNIMK